ncbi:MAG: gamma-glutamylcyclotransferase [Rhodospirillaceae bacterium]|nr:gamma-glutamylcyclotransferase [Rhodospirillaceae bacterium]
MREKINIFIYGTLLDEDVSSRVIMETFRVIPASLSGYCAVYVRGHSYPGITRKNNSVASGGIIRGLSKKAIARLEFFEGENYSLEEISVDVRGASERSFFFAPGPGVTLSNKPWELIEWRRRHKRAYLNRYF